VRHVDDGPDTRPGDSRRFEEIRVAGWKAAYDGRFARMPQPLQVLWTLEGDLPARRFYERHGFATAGARRLRALGVRRRRSASGAPAYCDRMADVSVRPARPEDAERVARVQLLTWRTAYGSFLPEEALAVPEEQAAALWLRAVELPPSPRHRLLVALDGTDLVGFAASGPAEDDDLDPATTAEITTLLVEPRWGRRGHGSRLVAATVDHWRQDDVATAVSWVWERDTASRAFLVSAGWGPDGAARGLDTGPRVERQLRLHTDLGAGA
jgi:GNAT superfamily N-acetyltransferase